MVLESIVAMLFWFSSMVNMFHVDTTGLLNAEVKKKPMYIRYVWPCINSICSVSFSG